MDNLLRTISDEVTINADLDLNVSSDFIFAVTNMSTSQPSFDNPENPENTFRANSFSAWAIGFIVWNNNLRLVEILRLQMVYCNYFPHSLLFVVSMRKHFV